MNYDLVALLPITTEISVRDLRGVSEKTLKNGYLGSNDAFDESLLRPLAVRIVQKVSKSLWRREDHHFVPLLGPDQLRHLLYGELVPHLKRRHHRLGRDEPRLDDEKSHQQGERQAGGVDARVLSSLVGHQPALDLFEEIIAFLAIVAGHDVVAAVVAVAASFANLEIVPGATGSQRFRRKAALRVGKRRNGKGSAEGRRAGAPYYLEGDGSPGEKPEGSARTVRLRSQACLVMCPHL
mmetsp:Transcript_26149/g.60110  ORF Transcript_26149/g.60110 Transcript_26149/m.60110 type:complete len:238 (-) Transcript_26149:148-861(-)